MVGVWGAQGRKDVWEGLLDREGMKGWDECKGLAWEGGLGGTGVCRLRPLAQGAEG